LKNYMNIIYSLTKELWWKISTGTIEIQCKIY